MAERLITLTTDFGDGSPYVAAMKGVLLSINPRAQLLDLSHRIPPQDLRHAAFFLAATAPYFRAGTLHVIVVDPGVGTDRAILYVELGQQALLVPDNGCWTYLAEQVGELVSVRRLAEPRYWRRQPSATFHGRDIFAPAAAHLSLGIEPCLLGPVVQEWQKLSLPAPRQTAHGWQGEVVFLDPFGNLITNLKGELLDAPTTPATCRIGDVEICRRVRTYGEAKPGELILLNSSFGLVEIACNCGNAAKLLNSKVGAPVTLTLT